MQQTVMKIKKGQTKLRRAVSVMIMTWPSCEAGDGDPGGSVFRDLNADGTYDKPITPVVHLLPDSQQQQCE